MVGDVKKLGIARIGYVAPPPSPNIDALEDLATKNALMDLATVNNNSKVDSLDSGRASLP